METGFKASLIFWVCWVVIVILSKSNLFLLISGAIGFIILCFLGGMLDKKEWGEFY